MIIGAMLVRNEAGRYLDRVLEQMQLVCDRVVVVDDASTDDTVEICRKHVPYVHMYSKSYFESNELRLRKFLWNLAAKNDGDWILCLDADETIPDIERLPEVIKLAEQRGADSIGFRLYDMWSETHYRDDENWTAHRKLWPLCVRYDAEKQYHWNEQPLHCGRFPINAAERIADARMNVQHWGWSRQADRERKYEFYKRIDVQELGNAAQYESILDPAPNLRLYGAKRVLIGAPVRQDAKTFMLYLESLKALNTDGLEVDFFFLLHNSPHLKGYLQDRNYQEVHFDGDERYDNELQTHNWTGANLSAVARMRNMLLQATKTGGFDYLLMVDSDLILHPQTLQQLVAADKPIVSNVFWTRWAPDEPEMPNAWMYDSYHFDTKERIEKWREPGLHRVGMTGACTLIRRDVIESGANFNPIPNVSFTNWEDRAFCIRAALHGFDIWMDTTYPAKHLYREEDVREVMASASI